MEETASRKRDGNGLGLLIEAVISGGRFQWLGGVAVEEWPHVGVGVGLTDVGSYPQISGAVVVGVVVGGGSSDVCKILLVG